MTELKNILTNMVNDQGLDILSDSKRFKALFMDYSGAEKRGDMELICKIIDIDSYNTIINSEELNISKQMLIKKLNEDYYIDQTICNNFIEIYTSILRKDNKNITVTELKKKYNKSTVNKTSIKNTKSNSNSKNSKTSVKIPKNIEQDIFIAYGNANIPFDGGYILSSFIDNSNYTIIEIINYSSVKEIYPSAEGLTFVGNGNKLFLLIEPDSYHQKYLEPNSRPNAEKIPKRFSELDVIITEEQTKIMISKEPVTCYGSFTILKPSGNNFSVIFPYVENVLQSIGSFLTRFLNKNYNITLSEAKNASKITIENLNNDPKIENLTPGGIIVPDNINEQNNEKPSLLSIIFGIILVSFGLTLIRGCLGCY